MSDMLFRSKFLFLFVLSFSHFFTSAVKAKPLDQIECDEEIAVKPNPEEYEKLKLAFYSTMKHLSEAADDGNRDLINDLIGPLRSLADRMGIDQSHCSWRIDLAKAIVTLGPEDKVLPLFRRLYSSLFFTICKNLNARDDHLSEAYSEASNIGLDIEHLRQIRFLLFFREEGQLRRNFFSELDKLVELTSHSNLKRRIDLRKLNLCMNTYSSDFAKALNVSID